MGISSQCAPEARLSRRQRIRNRAVEWTLGMALVLGILLAIFGAYVVACLIIYGELR